MVWREEARRLATGPMRRRIAISSITAQRKDGSSPLQLIASG